MAGSSALPACMIALSEAQGHALPCANNLQEALSTIRAWNAHPTLETATLMGADSGATMMLSMMPQRAQRMSLQQESKLCEMKDKILALFDTLLNKLGGEELSANITMGKVLTEGLKRKLCPDPASIAILLIRKTRAVL